MRMRGFTLIEMVVTMVVGAILVLGIAGFVQLGTQGYADSVDRQRLQTQAKFVIAKMTREVRHAVPNIFAEDLANNCVKFYPIIDYGFYAVAGDDLLFIIGDTSASLSSIQNKRLLINPTQTLLPSEDLSNVANSFDLASAVQVSPGVFALPNQATKLVGGSVVHRHYITDEDRRVTYCVSGNRVTRQVGPNGEALPLTDRDAVSVAGDFRYQPASVQHNGIVHMDLGFTQAGETTRYRQDVQVLNVP